MKKRYYVWMAGLAAVLLAGCGKKQEAPAAPAQTQVAAQEEEAGEDAAGTETAGGERKMSGRHWKIGGQVRQTSLYLYYARDLGLFEEAGLDVEIVTLANGPALNEALNAGEIEAAANGMAAVYVLPTENFYYVGDTTINFGGQAMYGRTDSDIVKAGTYGDTKYYGSPESVAGANVLGLGAGPQQFIAYAYAEAMGLDSEAIEFVAMDHAQAYEAFITGQGDLLATTPPYSNVLESDSAYTMVADYMDLAGGPLVDSFIVNRDLAEEYPDDVVAILECCYEAMDRLARDDKARSEYAMDLYKNEGGTTYSDEDMASEIKNVTFWTWESLENPEYPFGNTMVVMGEFLMGQGLIEEGSMPQIEEALNHSYIDRLLQHRKETAK
ncbi:MAG: ABC transporter substrate-binding protein [Lachnospiraceae bacterium]|jgi:ABC-type nitrate/sulfonate/bicarbonate transport system substrate-binding protein|nr:ABC transporter substrate-binding protein [Lachnospiraceae bacterium]